MEKLKKIFLLILILVVVSIGMSGCKHHSDQNNNEHPTSEHPK